MTWSLPGLADSQVHWFERSWRIHPAGILCGLSLIWIWFGLQTVIAIELDPLETTGTVLATLSLLFLSIAPSLSAWFEDLLKRLTPKRLASDRDTIAAPPALTPHHQLPWLTLSIAAGAAGGYACLLLLLLPTASHLHQQLLREYFWNNWTLAILEWSGVAMLFAPLWLLIGLTIAHLEPAARDFLDPAHPVTGPIASRPGIPGLAPGLMLGSGIGGLLHQLWSRIGLTAERELLLGALPLFMLAALSIHIAQRKEKRKVLAPHDQLPERFISRGGLLLQWVSLFVFGVAAALIFRGWSDSRILMQGFVSDSGTLLGLLLFAILIGYWARERIAHNDPAAPLAAPFGFAFWMTGFGSLLLAAQLTWMNSFFGSVLLQASLIGLCLGLALHDLERAWLQHTHLFTHGYGELISCLAAGIAVALVAEQWWIGPHFHALGTLMAGGLMFLIFGGMVQLFEPHATSRRYRVRMAALFLSLAVTILLFPPTMRHWLQFQRRQFIPPAPPAWSLLQDLPFPIRSACLIGIPPALSRQGAPDSLIHLDLFALDPPMRRTAGLEPISAWRWMRMSHERYPLIYQQLPLDRNHAGRTACTAEWMNQLAEQSAAGGLVALDLDLSNLTREGVQRIAETYRQVFSQCRWAVVPDPGRPRLLLLARPTGQNGIPALNPDRWHSVDRLIPASSPPPMITLRQSGHLPRQSFQQDHAGEMLAWLRSCMR